MEAPQQNPSGKEALLVLPLANENQLLKVTIGASALKLLCGSRNEDVGPFGWGDLTVVALRNPGVETLGMVFCTVGGYYWPLGKDSTVLRVGPRRFCFSLPSLLYGLTLPDRCTDDQLKKLEQILKTFCTYQDHCGEGSEFCAQEPESDFWASAYPSIMAIISAVTSSLSVPAYTEEVELRLPGRETPISGMELQQGYALAMHRALRFSAMSKLVIRALLRGLIKQDHISLRGAPAASQPAIASIRAVSDVVDVSDLALHANVGISLPETNRRFPPETETYWTFEEGGLLLILRLVTALSLLADFSSAFAGTDEDDAA